MISKLLDESLDLVEKYGDIPPELWEKACARHMAQDGSDTIDYKPGSHRLVDILSQKYGNCHTKIAQIVINKKGKLPKNTTMLFNRTQSLIKEGIDPLYWFKTHFAQDTYLVCVRIKNKKDRSITVQIWQMPGDFSKNLDVSVSENQSAQITVHFGEDTINNIIHKKYDANTGIKVLAEKTTKNLPHTMVNWG